MLKYDYDHILYEIELLLIRTSTVNWFAILT